jgi:hypothetical protein
MNILDLLSVVGRLSISGESSFNEAVRLTAGEEINPFNLRRSLEGLGHIKWDYAKREVRVLSPRLCLLPKKNADKIAAVLAGARTKSLIEQMEHFSSIFGIDISKSEPLDGGLPDRILLHGHPESLKRFAGGMVGARLSISEDTTIPDAWRLLSRVPFLHSLIEPIIGQQSGYDLNDPQPSDQIFNSQTGYYDPWEILRDNYQSRIILWKKTIYDYRLAWRSKDDGGWIRFLRPLDMDPFWARWAVRVTSGTQNPLPKVSPDGIFSIPSTCPLPMDLHRVCCLCSGYPPTVNGQAIDYQNVSPIIQHGVIQRLSLSNL